MVQSTANLFRTPFKSFGSPVGRGFNPLLVLCILVSDSSRRQISELEEKLEQKEGVERELSSKVSALEQSLRRRESTEKELEQKLERLQGDLEREKLHTQASRDQWNSARFVLSPFSSDACSFFTSPGGLLCRLSAIS
jgi:hypothetical protein